MSDKQSAPFGALVVHGKPIIYSVQIERQAELINKPHSIYDPPPIYQEYEWTGRSFDTVVLEIGIASSMTSATIDAAKSLMSQWDFTWTHTDTEMFADSVLIKLEFERTSIRAREESNGDTLTNEAPRLDNGITME